MGLTYVVFEIVYIVNTLNDQKLKLMYRLYLKKYGFFYCSRLSS